MGNSVGVVGVYQTPYKEAYSETTLEELIFRATGHLLEEAGVSLGDLSNIVTASSDATDGRAISNMLTSGPAGSYLKNSMNLSSASEHAFLLATMQIMSGVQDLTLVISWSKPSESPMDAVERVNSEPYFTRPLGLNMNISYALQAAAYQHAYEPDKDSISQVVIKNRQNGLENPLAHVHETPTVDQIREAAPLYWPLTEYEVPPYSDGVCALLLSSEERAESFDSPVAWVKGLGWATDSYWMGGRDLTKLSSLETAAKKAYERAGIEEPLEQLDLAELHETSSYNEVMQYEALGFADYGEGEKLLDEEVTFREGKLPVNLSGGALCSNPPFASGLIRFAEAALQVTDRADARQVQGAKMALATAQQGFASQGATVACLERG
jgi:acetyl-CoA C-acetyltransferase